MEEAPSADVGRWVKIQNEQKNLLWKLPSSTGHIEFKPNPSVWNNLQAGPRTVCRSGAPSWSWLFPVLSWSALSGGCGRLEASSLVSVSHFRTYFVCVFHTTHTQNIFFLAEMNRLHSQWHRELTISAQIRFCFWEWTVLHQRGSSSNWRVWFLAPPHLSCPWARYWTLNCSPWLWCCRVNVCWHFAWDGGGVFGQMFVQSFLVELLDAFYDGSLWMSKMVLYHIRCTWWGGPCCPACFGWTKHHYICGMDHTFVDI